MASNVAPPKFTESWMPHAKFDHAAHTGFHVRELPREGVDEHGIERHLAAGN